MGIKRGSTMRIDKAGLDLIKEFEGFSATPYRDVAGVPTIGYGTTHYIDRPVDMLDHSIDKKIATHLLESQVNSIYGKAVSHYAQVDLTQNEFDALTSFAYNLGVSALKHSHLLRYLNDGNKEAASKEFRKWSHANGKVVKGLLARREQEQELFNA